MPVVPLGTKAYRRADAMVPETRLVNMWLEKDESGVSPDGLMRVQRPGLRLLETRPNPIRALAYRLATGEEVTVSDRLYVSTMDKGAIGGSGVAPIVDTPFHLAILGGNTLYLYANTLVAIAMPNDAGEIVDIDQLNGYILILTRTGRFYWIEPGASTVDPLNFATAESSPDMGVAIRRVGDEFWIFGDSSVEPWQATGDLDAPFQPVTGRVYESGCLSRDSVKRFDNSVFWVTDALQVARGGSVPTVVSDNGISERLRKRTGAPSAFTFPWDGHDFYVLRIPGQGTFAYDASTQNWCEFSTLGSGVWRPVVAEDHGGVVRVGDSDSGAVWALDGDLATDDGAAMEWVVTGTVGFLGRTGRNNSLGIGVGVSGDAVVRIRWKDGQQDFPAYYDELPVRAPLDVANIYRMGRPEQPYRTVEVSGVSPVRHRIAGAMINEAWK